MKSKSKAFAVKSKSFNTYYGFKEDLERLGYTYNHLFVKFTGDNTINNECLYICNNWIDEGDYKFSLSNMSGGTKYFDIDNEIEYNKAIQYADDFINNKGKYKIIIEQLSDFRLELIKMIENVKYNTGEYEDLSSSKIAEMFEIKINDFYKTK